MDNLMQVLFNTNHEMPSGWVLVALILIAVVIPSVMRYVQERKALHRYEKEQALKEELKKARKKGKQN